MSMRKKPEILAPAGTLEKLKTAIHYGADAVYIGGNAYGLRTRAGNFTVEEMREAVDFAARHQAKVYVAANMVAHEGDLEGAEDFFQELQAIGVAAVIISDPALMEICRESAPQLPIHLSTQASTTNAQALAFWEKEGVERAVLARETSLADICQIRAGTKLELETFIHGAMCISYSGHCTLSNHMSLRDANRGGCSQSCRWKYDIFELAGDQRHSLVEAGKKAEPFSMSAVDLSMIEHIPDLMNSGIDSLKIEGRMKSIHYVSTVVNVYRTAIDRYFADPDTYFCDPEWIAELWKVAQRELATGFYYQSPTEQEQLFGVRRKIPVYKFIGEVLAYDSEKKQALIRQRNHFQVGDDVEFYGPGFRHFHQTVTQMWDEAGLEISKAPHPMMILSLPVEQPVQVGDMLRKALTN